MHQTESNDPTSASPSFPAGALTSPPAAATAAGSAAEAVRAELAEPGSNAAAPAPSAAPPRPDGTAGDAEGSPHAPLEPGRDLRDANPQFVLPLVVRIERDAPPQRTDALETAARAVLTLLADARSAGDGEWAGAVRAWQDGRIRKVVRRARGAEWRRALELAGITVTGRAAEVRVYPPIPLDGWPKDLARLQVSGTDLADSAPPPEPEPGTPVLWLNPAASMSAGKAMAQAGHAAQLGWMSLAPDAAARWAAQGFPLAVRTAEPWRWARLAEAPLPMVRDAGFTEVAPGTATAIAQLER